MAPQLRGEQRGDVPVALPGEGGVSQVAHLSAAVEPGAGEQGAEPCRLRIDIWGRSAACWCSTHGELVGAVLGPVGLARRQAEAWRAAGVCEKGRR